MIALWNWWWYPGGVGFQRAGVILASLGFIATVALGLVAWWLAKRQVEIAKRQTDMQAAQFKFFEESVSKKTDLRIFVQGIDSKYDHRFHMTETVRFQAHNGGNKSADGFYWEILVPEEREHLVKFVDEAGVVLEAKISHHSDTETYKKIDGHYTHKLFPFSGLEIARIAFDAMEEKLDAFTIKWRIRGEDGMIPPEGLAFIKFTRASTGVHAWSVWHPGQKEEDIQ